MHWRKLKNYEVVQHAASILVIVGPSVAFLIMCIQNVLAFKVKWTQNSNKVHVAVSPASLPPHQKLALVNCSM